jgi:hypothetical protein
MPRVRLEEGAVAFDLCGAPGERVSVGGWSAREPAGVRVSDPHAGSRDPHSGRWRRALELPDRG